MAPTAPGRSAALTAAGSAYPLTLSGRQRRRQFLEQTTGIARDLVPGREHDAVSQPAGDAPFFAVVLVVGRVVVPSPAVRLENRSFAFEGEVEEVCAAV